MVVVVSFHWCGVISCELARRCVWRGAAEASGSGFLHVWESQRGRSDVDRRSRAVCFPDVDRAAGVVWAGTDAGEPGPREEGPRRRREGEAQARDGPEGDAGGRRGAGPDQEGARGHRPQVTGDARICGHVIRVAR